MVEVLVQSLVFDAELAMQAVYLIDFCLEFESESNLFTECLLSSTVLVDKHAFLVI
jgi:hypothetical protein